MELWIRSKDKMKLTRVIDIGIFEEQEGYTIYYDDSIDNMLGTYATKGRALEILNEIQNLLQPKIKYIQEEPVESIVDFGYQITQNVDMKIQEINRIVYEMPKE